MKLVNNYNGFREPVYNNLFIAEIVLPNLIKGDRDEKWLTVPCYQAQIPSITVNQVEMHYINTKFYYATADYNFDDLQLSFYNYNIGTKNIRSILYDWIQLILNWNQGTKGYAGSSMDVNDGYKTSVTVYELNPDGESVHTAWVFTGAFPKTLPAITKNWESKGDVDKVDGVPFRFDRLYRINVATPIIGQTTWELNPEPLS